MRVIAIILAASLLAAGAAYAATSLLENADGTGDDPVGNLSPVGTIGSEPTSTEDRKTRTDDGDRTTTDDMTTEDSTTEEATTEDHGGESENSGSGSDSSGHGSGEDD
jgi:hypothetical protein